MDIVRETEDGADRLRLDLSSACPALVVWSILIVTICAAARFASYFSHYDTTDSAVSAYFIQTVRFFSTDYFLLLLHYGIDIVSSTAAASTPFLDRDRDSICSTASDRSGWSISSVPPSPRPQSDLLAWADYDESMTGAGLDQVLTISEQSINTLFTTLWKTSDSIDGADVLARWSYDGFKASFDAVKARLLPNGRAIVWVNIDEGETAVTR